jgi:hypothetical protein
MTSLPGYDQCRVLTGANFENVFNLNLWAANAKLINYYMLYGYAPHSGACGKPNKSTEELRGAHCHSQESIASFSPITATSLAN